VGAESGEMEMVAPEFDRFVERYHRALAEFFRGDPEPAKALYSHLADATLANPFGPVGIGWSQVAETLERASSHYRDGEIEGFERLAAHVTPALAYLSSARRPAAGGSCIGTPIRSRPLGRRNPVLREV